LRYWCQGSVKRCTLQERTTLVGKVSSCFCMVFQSLSTRSCDVTGYFGGLLTLRYGPFFTDRNK
jgi:hypothetical protein